MMNVFPIMFLSLLAHAILRIATGGVLIYMSGDHLRTLHTPGAPKRTLIGLALIELILGGMMIVGILTQIAALGALALAFLMLVIGRRLRPHVPSPLFFILLIAISASLFITGAGALAIDMPF